MGMKQLLNFQQMLLVILMATIIFSHKLFVTNTQVSKLHKTFFCKLFLSYIKTIKNQLHKKEQLGGLLGRLLKTITKHWIAFNEKCT